MQQAYQAIRIVSEAQTIRVGLSTDPDELMLRELCTFCASLSGGASDGIKAVVLDFSSVGKSSRGEASKDGVKDGHNDSINHVPPGVERAYGAVCGIAQPVLGVARDTLSPVACKLLSAADFTLVAEDARLIIMGKGEEQQDYQLSGANAARLRSISMSLCARRTRLRACGLFWRNANRSGAINSETSSKEIQWQNIVPGKSSRTNKLLIHPISRCAAKKLPFPTARSSPTTT